MAKGTRGRRGIASRQCRPTPYPIPAPYPETDDTDHLKNCSKIKINQDWENVTCSVCMECPHNAVLLLCSSHEKGCRPYMCGTSFRYSNCLDQYKKAYTKAPENDTFSGTFMELVCPLCRGQVKGWTIVEPAREHLNRKTRCCTQDNCPFIGTYKELRKHVRAEHPCAKPREVDPTLEQKWRRLEREREREDVMTTIRSSTPGAVFFGDYVIEGNNRYDFDSDDDDEVFYGDGGMEGGDGGIDRNLMSVFLLLQAFGSSGGGNVGPGRGTGRQERGPNNVLGNRRVFHYSDEDDDDDEDEDDSGNYGTSLASRLGRRGSVILGRSGRRRRHREANGEGR